MLPIDEQTIGVGDGLRPSVVLLCVVVLEVLEELAVSFTVSSQEESTDQVLLSGVLLGGFQRSWGCCVPCHCGVRGGERSINQSGVNTEVSPQCSMTSTLFWNFSRYAWHVICLSWDKL